MCHGCGVDNESTAIRRARHDEVKVIVELEELAGMRYADAGLPADLAGLPDDIIATAIDESLLWVITEKERPVGFALCWLRPNALHLRELDVHPERMGRGFGGRLVEYVSQQAQQKGLAYVTLTTFRDVAWNAPLYRRWGFNTLEVSKQPDWLRKIRQLEDDGELRQWPRVAMARPLR